MIHIGRRQQTFALASALVAWSVLTDCASTLPAAAERSNEPVPASVAAAPAPAAAQPPAADPCPNVRQSGRTFIGFAPDQSLDDFDQTAEQAEEVLSAIKVQLCRLAPEQDSGGALRAALVRGGAEVTSVSFKTAKLVLADVGVRTPAASATQEDPEQKWIVRMARNGQTWRVLTAAIKPKK